VALLLAYASSTLLVASLTPVLPLPLHFDPRPDVRVLIATTVFAVVSTLVFGLGPALKLSRSDVVADLKEVLSDARGRRARVPTRGWLVVGQIAVSLVLMTAGGLFARGAMKASATDPGFRYDRELLVSLDPSLAGYDEARGAAAYRAVLDRLRSLPGVEAAGMASLVPFGDINEGSPVDRPGRTSADTVNRSPTYTIIGADYFRALGLSMRRGREFTRVEEESPSAAPVAIIDELLAGRLFPNEDPIGQEVRLTPGTEGGGTDQRERSRPMQIVGVSPSLRDELLDRGVGGHLYVQAGRHYRGNMNIHVRVARAGTRAETDMLETIRRSLRALDSRLPILELTAMRTFHDRGLVLWAVRAAGRTLTGFGVLALLLAAVGVYGLKSYVVSQRTREIGIRMALGASQADVLWMVLREGATLTLIGLAIGFPLALGLARFLSRVLVGVSPFDPIVLTLAPLTLAAAAALATYVPARRATRVTPLEALHAQ
jgi:predicted permease